MYLRLFSSKRQIRKILIVPFMLCFLLLSACQNKLDEVPHTHENISITSNDINVIGETTNIKIAISPEKFAISTANESTYKIRLIFPEAGDEQKFKVSYSPSCSVLKADEVCTVEVQSISNNIGSTTINYDVLAVNNANGVSFKSQTHQLTIKSPKLSAISNNTIGAGASEKITLLNDTGVSINISGVSIQSDNAQLSFSNNECATMTELPNQYSCDITMTASNDAKLADSTVNLLKDKLVIASVHVKVVRPTLTISPSKIEIRPNSLTQLSIVNHSNFPIKDLSTSLSQANLQITEPCPKTMPKVSVCHLMIKSDANFNSKAQLTLSADNMDTMESDIDYLPPLQISVMPSTSYFYTVENTSKSFSVTVTNNSSDSISNLSASVDSKLIDLDIDRAKSSCMNASKRPLPAKQSCRFTFNYTPQKIVYPVEKEAKITIQGDDIESVSTTVDIQIFHKYRPFKDDLFRNIPGMINKSSLSTPLMSFLGNYYTACGSTCSLTVYNSEKQTSTIKIFTGKNGHLQISERIFPSKDKLYITTQDILTYDFSIVIADLEGNQLKTITSQEIFNEGDDIQINGVFVQDNIIYVLGYTSNSDQDNNFNLRFSYSKDQGNTWHPSQTIKHYKVTFGLDQYVYSGFVWHGIIYIPTAKNGLIYSTNNGLTWQAASLKGTDNPNNNNINSVFISAIESKIYIGGSGLGGNLYSANVKDIQSQNLQWQKELSTDTGGIGTIFARDGNVLATPYNLSSYIWFKRDKNSSFNKISFPNKSRILNVNITQKNMPLIDIFDLNDSDSYFMYLNSDGTWSSVPKTTPDQLYPIKVANKLLFNDHDMYISIYSDSIMGSTQKSIVRLSKTAGGQWEIKQTINFPSSMTFIDDFIINNNRLYALIPNENDDELEIYQSIDQNNLWGKPEPVADSPILDTDNNCIFGSTGDNIYIGCASTSTDVHIYRLQQGHSKWESSIISNAGAFDSFIVGSKRVYVATDDKLIVSKSLDAKLFSTINSDMFEGSHPKMVLNNNKLYIASDKGVAYIDTDNPMQLNSINKPAYSSNTVVNDIQINNNTIYLSTNTGLYIGQCNTLTNCSWHNESIKEKLSNDIAGAVPYDNNLYVLQNGFPLYVGAIQP
ncbi:MULTISPECIES: sialidase family protein [Cysteiniphilum]|nr:MULTISPECIES: sialidase family protein [Cysteiniphilum]